MVVEANKWDLFICHASEDKETVARPLYEALTKTGLRVWYDDSALKLGDRLHKSINMGIAESGYGIVILSENFFAKDWPQRELEGLAAKEHEGQKVILPIWHEVDAKYIRQKSPILAGLYAVTTKEGIDEIVRKVLEVVRPNIVDAHKSKDVPKAASSKESTRGSLEKAISSLRTVDKSRIPALVKHMAFEDLKTKCTDVLDAVALFDVAGWSDRNEGIFAFILAAILERNRSEGTELFGVLQNWYFGTAAPLCKDAILQIFAKLTKLSHIKEAVIRTNRTRDFVAEFGRSDTCDIAGINAEILQNIKSSLSENDCGKIVDFALANDQINGSWRAKEYLVKLLPTCQGKVEQEKLDDLYRKLQ